MKKTLLIALAMAAASMFPSTASASSVTLNQSGCCGNISFGTVNVTQFAVGVVDVLVTLNSGVFFVNTGNAPPSNHPDFGWNLTGAPDLSGVGVVTIVNDGGTAAEVFTWGLFGSAGASDNLGTFMYQLSCTNCGNGASPPQNPGPLQFRIALAGITPDSFIASAGGSIHAFFVADVISQGNTGLVWSLGDPSDEPCTGICGQVVPEPATLALLGSGLLAASLSLRRRKKA